MGFHFTMPINSKDKAKEPTRLLRPRDSPGRNTGVGLPCPSPGDLPDLGIKHSLLNCGQMLYPLGHQGSPWP